MSAKKKNKKINLQHLTCKVSDAVYKKHLVDKFGLRVCTGALSDEDIEDLHEDLQLLKYVQKHNLDCCTDKLIERLK